MQLLLKLVNFLKSNVSYQKRIRQKEIEAINLQRELTLKRGLTLLLKNKLSGDLAEQKVDKYLKNKN
jgi:hypothetical protein